MVPSVGPIQDEPAPAAYGLVASYPFKPALPRDLSYHRTMEAFGGPQAFLALASPARAPASATANPSPCPAVVTATCASSSAPGPTTASPMTYFPTASTTNGDHHPTTVAAGTTAGNDAAATLALGAELQAGAYSLDIGQQLEPLLCSRAEYVRTCARAQVLTDQGMGGPLDRRHFVLWPDLPAVQAIARSVLCSSLSEESGTEPHTEREEAMDTSAWGSEMEQGARLELADTEDRLRDTDSGTGESATSSRAMSGGSEAISEASTCAPSERSPHPSERTATLPFLPPPPGLSLEVEGFESHHVDWRQCLLPSILKLEPAWTEWNWSRAS